MKNPFKKLWSFSGTTDLVRVEASSLGVSLIQENGGAICFGWKEVTQIDALKRDLGTLDEVVFEFRLHSPDRVILISEELDEFTYFVRYLEETWPIIPKDWREKVVKPAFAENRTMLFKAPN